MSADNKSLVRRLAEEVRRGDLDAATKLLAEDAVEHGGGRAIDSIKRLREAFPDADLVQDDLVAEGDLVVERFTLTGTHRGEFHGWPASGRRVRLRGVNVYRIAHGRIVERWAALDEAGLAEQLAPGAALGLEGEGRGRTRAVAGRSQY